MLQWEKNTDPYASGEHARLGRWIVGGWHYDSMRSRDDPRPYAATNRLPGLGDRQGHFRDSDQAKRRVEFVVRRWLAGLPEDIGDTLDTIR